LRDGFKVKTFKEDGIKCNKIPVYNYNQVSIHTQDSPMSPKLCIVLLPPTVYFLYLQDSMTSRDSKYIKSVTIQIM